jgi:hypothetical protein
MWSDLAPAAAEARSDRKWLHITARSQGERRTGENDPLATVVTGRFRASH